MADQPPRPPSAATPSSGGPDRQALLRAYQDLVKEEHDKRSGGPEVPPPPPSRAPFWITMLALVGILASLLLVQPAWLFPKAPVEPPELKEASLRVRMYVEIDRIEQYRRAHGRLPDTLLESLGDTTGLRYASGEGGYSLTGESGAVSLTYSSSQSPEEFLGRSYDLIRRRGKS